MIQCASMSYNYCCVSIYSFGYLFGCHFLFDLWILNICFCFLFFGVCQIKDKPFDCINSSVECTRLQRITTKTIFLFCRTFFGLAYGKICNLSKSKRTQLIWYQEDRRVRMGRERKRETNWNDMSLVSTIWTMF